MFSPAILRLDVQVRLISDKQASRTSFLMDTDILVVGYIT
jgi:hypothetical protein